MKTIGIDQSSFARSSFEHRCMNNIKKIYQHAGKCDDKQNLKDIIDAAILSTPEGVTDIFEILLIITLPCMFIYLFDVVHTSVFKRRPRK